MKLTIKMKNKETNRVYTAIHYPKSDKEIAKIIQSYIGCNIFEILLKEE